MTINATTGPILLPSGGLLGGGSSRASDPSPVLLPSGRPANTSALPGAVIISCGMQTGAAAAPPANTGIDTIIQNILDLFA